MGRESRKVECGKIGSLHDIKLWIAVDKSGDKTAGKASAGSNRRFRHIFWAWGERGAALMRLEEWAVPAHACRPGMCALRQDHADGSEYGLRVKPVAQDGSVMAPRRWGSRLRGRSSPCTCGWRAVCGGPLRLVSAYPAVAACGA